MNKKHLYIIITILLLVIVSLLSYKRSETYIFKSDIPIFTNNFGQIEKKDSIELETNYVNKEFKSIKIYDIKDGCDCTKSKVKSGFYKKNATINIKTVYYPNKYKDSGQVTKQIFLLTNKKNAKNDTLIPINLKGFVQ